MKSSSLAVNMEMTTVDDPVVVQQQQRPAEPIVQQAETEIVDETKYVHSFRFHTYISFCTYSYFFLLHAWLLTILTQVLIWTKLEEFLSRNVY